MATCSDTGIRGFPILNRVTVTDTLNKSIQEDFLLDIQWGQRSIAPRFSNSEGILDEVGASSQTTTLRLQGNSYNLLSVQMAAPQHPSFLAADRAPAAKAEMILIFKTNAELADKYVFLCIPVLAKSTTTRNVYLEALRTDRLAGKPIGLDTLLPQTPGFISYSTCVTQLGRLVSGTLQIRVLVMVQGIEYPEPFLREIRAKIPGTPRQKSSTPLIFPTLSLPDRLLPQNKTTIFTITNELDYKALLRYGIYGGSGAPSKRSTRVDSVSAYQCVPLKPDRDIRNGQITVDTATGKPLSTVLEDKQADEDDFQGPPSRFTPAQIEKVLSISLAVFILLCFALFIAYLVMVITTKRQPGVVEFSSLRSWFVTWGPRGIAALLIGVTGFLLGMFVG